MGEKCTDISLICEGYLGAASAVQLTQGSKRYPLSQQRAYLTHGHPGHICWYFVVTFYSMLHPSPSNWSRSSAWPWFPDADSWRLGVAALLDCQLPSSNNRVRTFLYTSYKDTYYTILFCNAASCICMVPLAYFHTNFAPSTSSLDRLRMVRGNISKALTRCMGLWIWLKSGKWLAKMEPSSFYPH